jgi:hypothetical protein
LSSISSLSAQSESVQAQTRHGSGDAVFGQSLKKLFASLSKSFSRPPSVIFIPNRQTAEFDCKASYFSAGPETDFERFGQTVRRDSLLNALIGPRSVGVLDRSNLLAHNLANRNIQLAWQLIEAHEDSEALDLVQGEERSIRGPFNQPSDEIVAIYDEIKPPSLGLN